MPVKFAKWWLALLLFTLGKLAIAAPLKLCFEDVPQHPWTMPDGTGLNFELLNRVEKSLDEKFIYLPMPWKRCQEEVRSGEADGIIGAAENAERRTYVIFPTLPTGALDITAMLYDDQFNVYLREGGDGAWDGKNLSSPGHSVIVQSGYLVIVSMLRERGVKTYDPIKSAEDGLRFLSEGMADVAVLQSVEAEYLRREDNRFQQNILVSPTPFAILPLFLAINHTTYAHSPKRIEAIWNAMRSVRNSSEYRKLLDSACRDKANAHCND